MKKCLLTMIVLLVLLLCGCQPKTKSENEIKADISEEMRTINIGFDWEYITYNESFVLEIEEFEIEKRQTNKKDDTIYCNITMQNENFKSYVEYVLYYNYYDEGGWILDDYDTLEQEIQPLKGLEEDLIWQYLHYFYDDYTFETASFDESAYVSEYTYLVEEKHQYCSLIGEVDVECEFYNDLNNGTWIANIYGGDIECVWDIDGKWYAGLEDTRYGVNSNSYYVVEANISSFDGQSAYIDFERTPATVSGGMNTKNKITFEGQVFPNIYDEGSRLSFELPYAKGGAHFTLQITYDDAKIFLGGGPFEPLYFTINQIQ